VSDLIGIAESLRSLSSKNVQFITAPNQSWPPDPGARVQFAQPQADEVFSAIAHDVTVPKVKVTPSAAPSSGGAQVLTTSPSNVKVEVLNGSGVTGIAEQAAIGLTSRGFDVTGTGNANTFAYTNSVIEYASASDMAAVNTLRQQLTDVTDLRDSTLTPGTVELILGSDFTTLTPRGPAPTVMPSASPGPSVSSSPSATPTTSASPSGSAVANLAQNNNGITAAAACGSDSSAFSGPFSP
jgi:LytR cell envelope-related transcriptional attenuator